MDRGETTSSGSKYQLNYLSRIRVNPYSAGRVYYLVAYIFDIQTRQFVREMGIKTANSKFCFD